MVIAQSVHAFGRSDQDRSLVGPSAETGLPKLVSKRLATAGPYAKGSAFAGAFLMWCGRGIAPESYGVLAARGVSLGFMRVAVERVRVSSGLVWARRATSVSCLLATDWRKRQWLSSGNLRQGTSTRGPTVYTDRRYPRSAGVHRGRDLSHEQTAPLDQDQRKAAIRVESRRHRRGTWFGSDPSRRSQITTSSTGRIGRRGNYHCGKGIGSSRKAINADRAVSQHERRAPETRAFARPDLRTFRAS